MPATQQRVGSGTGLAFPEPISELVLSICRTGFFRSKTISVLEQGPVLISVLGQGPVLISVPGQGPVLIPKLVWYHDRGPVSIISTTFWGEICLFLQENKYFGEEMSIFREQKSIFMGLVYYLVLSGQYPKNRYRNQYW